MNTSNSKYTTQPSRHLTCKNLTLYVSSIGLLPIFLSQPVIASDNEHKAFVDFRLRYERVEQDNALKDADALTLRTQLNFQTATYHGFNAVIEFEDSRDVLSVDNYNDALGSNPAYSVVADPNTTELDQGFLQYKGKGLTAKLGRQVIALDGQRFVGHVGWRQDRQTFDAFSVNYVNSGISATYAYITQRNRIFADERDVDSRDHLINVGYQARYGKFVAYGYLLEVDNGISNDLDTFGLSFDGKANVNDIPVSYRAEYATQSSENPTSDYDAEYVNLELGAKLAMATVKLGYELLGSDDGMYGFATPLATLHKFNGWSDQFLTTPSNGLEDIYLSVSAPVWHGNMAFIYHDYQADESLNDIDDLGDEINLSYSQNFATHYSAGIKYAKYNAGDTLAGKVDTDKLWLWVGAKF
ncbi:alginate export family protein [Thalassotalea maritima]|uniref:alginate export family protein n=1 Tax=Thalassotalea maritima TaxID=3242416 RepID=UPI003529B38D